MSYPDIVIIRIMGRRDLHGTSSKGHVDDNAIRHYWNTTVYEGMDGKLAVKVLWCQIGFKLRPLARQVDGSPYNDHHWDVQRWQCPRASSLDAWLPR